MSTKDKKKQSEKTVEKKTYSSTLSFGKVVETIVKAPKMPKVKKE